MFTSYLFLVSFISQTTSCSVNYPDLYKMITKIDCSFVKMITIVLLELREIPAICRTPLCLYTNSIKFIQIHANSYKFVQIRYLRKLCSWRPERLGKLCSRRPSAPAGPAARLRRPRPPQARSPQARSPAPGAWGLRGRNSDAAEV